MDEERSKLQLDWVKVVGGALAAMSSALLLSTLGAAGTIIGAAVGSVVVTVGGSVYSHYLDLSRQRVANVQVPVRRRADDGRIQPTVSRRERQQRTVSWRESLAGLPWRNIALGAMGMFLLVMVAITAFELVMGRAVSTYTGGSDRDTRTSITGHGGGGGSEGDDTEPSRTNAPDSEATEPTSPPTPTTGTPSPTATASPTPAETSPSTLRRSSVPSPTASPTPTSTTSEPPPAGLSPR